MLRCLLLSLTLATASALLWACAGEPRRLPVPPVGISSAVLDALPALSSLDAAAAPAGLPQRGSSGLDELNSIPLYRYLSAGGEVSYNGDESLTISAAGGGLAWVVYDLFNAGSECDSVELEFSQASPDLYLAAADYSLGRWRILTQPGPDPGSLSLSVDEPALYSPLERQYVAIIAANGGELRLTGLGFQVEVMDPVESIAIEAAGTGLQALECEGRPALVYRDAADRLMFALADSSSPQSPFDWQSSLVSDVDVPAFWRAELHQGKPVVIFSTDIFGDVWVAASASSAPQADSDWQRLQLGTTQKCGPCALCSDGELLHLAFFETDPGDEDLDGHFGYLDYGQSLGSDPLGGFSLSRVVPLGDITGAPFAQPDVCTIAGLPAMAIVDARPAGGNLLTYARALNASPAPADWSWHVQSGEAERRDLWLGTLLGNPVILYAAGFVRLTRCDSPQPDSGAQWLSEAVSPLELNPEFSLHMLNGYPSYCYTSFADASWHIACVSTSRGGEDQSPWQETGFRQTQLIGDLEFQPVPRMLSVGGRPAMAYLDNADGTIHYVRFDND